MSGGKGLHLPSKTEGQLNQNYKVTPKVPERTGVSSELIMSSLLDECGVLNLGCPTVRISATYFIQHSHMTSEHLMPAFFI